MSPGVSVAQTRRAVAFRSCGHNESDGTYGSQVHHARTGLHPVAPRRTTCDGSPGAHQVMTTLRHTADGSGVQRLNEAAEWLLRLNDEARSKDDVAEWLRWCDADPENVATFERVQCDWR